MLWCKKYCEKTNFSKSFHLSLFYFLFFYFFLQTTATKRKGGESYKSKNIKKSRHYDTSSEMELDNDDGWNFFFIFIYFFLISFHYYSVFTNNNAHRFSWREKKNKYFNQKSRSPTISHIN